VNKNYLLKGLITTLIILFVSTLLYLYTAGYRLRKDTAKPIDIKVTGMISAKSLPEGASVYLDDELVTATDDSIPGVIPGKHLLEIKKSGFTPWKKEIEIFPELVTDITAVLISETPRIEPLTNTGAKRPVMSPSLSAIAYLSLDDETPGVWVMPLNYNRISFFSSTPEVVLENTLYVKFSESLDIKWSPDEKELLVQQAENKYYLADLVADSAKSILVSDANEILEEWKKIVTENREDLIEKSGLTEEDGLTEELKKIALDPETSWAPDENKFLYISETTNSQGPIEYKVYNMEKPLPVGEMRENVVLTTNPNDVQPKLSWYADSFHLVMLDNPLEESMVTRETGANNGTENRSAIYLIRIDGTNKTEIYNNAIYSNGVLSSPGGDKIILLTSFKSKGITNLYTVSIR